MLVLAERGLAPAGLGVKAHESSVDDLLERIEREQLQGGLDGRLERARLSLLSEQASEDLQSELSQTLALAHEPLFERRFVERESGQQIALVEGGGPREALGRTRRRGLLERGDVGIHVRRIQTQHLGFLIEGLGVGRLERLANHEQGLAQARPRRFLTNSAPQERRELVARVGSAKRKREVGEHRLRLATGHAQKLTGFVAGLEAAEQGQSQLRHAASGPTPYHFPG